MAENGDDLSLDGFDTDDDSLSFDDMDLDSGMSEESVIGFDDGSTETSSDSDEFESLGTDDSGDSDDELLDALSEDAPVDEPETVSADAEMQFDVDGSADDLKEMSMDTEPFGGGDESEAIAEVKIESEEDPFAAHLNEDESSFSPEIEEDDDADPFLTSADPASSVSEDAVEPESEETILEEVPSVVAAAAGIAAVGIIAENSAQVIGEMSVGTELLMNVHHEATVEIARTRLTGEEITQLTHGSVIELDKSAGEPVDIVLNGKLVAHGEIVVINREKLGVRVIGIHQG
jgi:flagellar motor switch protein FliN/FliY